MNRGHMHTPKLKHNNKRRVSRSYLNGFKGKRDCTTIYCFSKMIFDVLLGKDIFPTVLLVLLVRDMT